jgi:hypothetical protein
VKGYDMAKEVEQPKEEPKPLILADLSLEKLKALGFDQMVELQRVQNNLNAIQAEINKRQV